eukprot:COSAG06_NODE_2865_length_6157_cov_30.730769_3_plen_146_part_00
MTAHTAQVDHEELLEDGLDAEQLLNQLEVKKLAHRKKILNGMLAIPCLAQAVAPAAAAAVAAAGSPRSAVAPTDPGGASSSSSSHMATAAAAVVVALPVDASECFDLMQGYADEWKAGRWQLQEPAIGILAISSLYNGAAQYAAV